MKTSKFVSFFVFLLVCILSISSYAGDKGKIRSEIEKINKQMASDFEAGKHDAMLSLYTSDAISMPQYSKMNKGIEQIKAHQTESMKNMPKFSNVKFETVEVLGDNELFVEIGKYTMTVETKGMDNPINDHGKYITVWKKQADGSLKIAADTWNTDIDYASMASQGDNKEMDKEMTGSNPDIKKDVNKTGSEGTN